MDAAELKRVMELVAKANDVTRQVEQLREVVRVGRETKAVKFVFEPFSIEYAIAGDVDRLRVSCSAHLLKELSHEFREAFIAIVERRLTEREKELEAISV